MIQGTYGSTSRLKARLPAWPASLPAHPTSLPACSLALLLEDPLQDLDRLHRPVGRDLMDLTYLCNMLLEDLCNMPVEELSLIHIYIYMYICICVDMHTYIYIYICIYICLRYLIDYSATSTEADGVRGRLLGRGDDTMNILNLIIIIIIIITKLLIIIILLIIMIINYKHIQYL